jgi:hypothetical protein
MRWNQVALSRLRLHGGRNERRKESRSLTSTMLVRHRQTRETEQISLAYGTPRQSLPYNQVANSLR